MKNPIYLEYYPHDEDCYKIDLPWPDKAKEKKVLCKESEGYGRAIILAIGVVVDHMVGCMKEKILHKHYDDDGKEVEPLVVEIKKRIKISLVNFENNIIEGIVIICKKNLDEESAFLFEESTNGLMMKRCKGYKGLPEDYENYDNIIKAFCSGIRKESVFYFWK